MVRSSFTLTGAFPLHAGSVTRNLRTYFTSVRRVFLVGGRIADCTVRYPGVERLCSSLKNHTVQPMLYIDIQFVLFRSQ